MLLVARGAICVNAWLQSGLCRPCVALSRGCNRFVRLTQQVNPFLIETNDALRLVRNAESCLGVRSLVMRLVRAVCCSEAWLWLDDPHEAGPVVWIETEYALRLARNAKSCQCV